MKSYFKKIQVAIFTLLEGFRVTLPHLLKRGKTKKNRNISEPGYFETGDYAVTLRYPMEQIPVPDNGRYRLHMEGEDCIVCDKCARICPVDCIIIEGVKADEPLGLTTDGSKKRIHLPVFDIDLAKCCFCGLCTTVCPTECLTMTKVYDYSETDRDDFIHHFSPMNEEEAQEMLSRKKEALK